MSTCSMYWSVIIPAMAAQNRWQPARVAAVATLAMSAEEPRDMFKVEEEEDNQLDSFQFMRAVA